MSRGTAMGVFALLLFGALPVQGQQWKGERLCAPELPSGAEFGSAVAVADDGTVAVGDYRHDVVYLFRRDCEGRCVRADPIEGDAGSWFGFALASDGSRLLIGAPRSGGIGAASLYDLKTGRREILRVPQAQRGDEVGSSVAIDGGTLVLGARGTDGRRGRVYFRTEGSFETVRVEGLAPNAELGQSVALSGTTLVMGAPSPYLASDSPGAAWVFEIGGDKLLPLMPPGGLEPEAAFGYAVAVAGGEILVGAPLAERAGTDAGAVYRFSRPAGGAWGPAGLQPLLTGDPGDQLGVALALDGETAVLGARYAASRRGEAILLVLGGGSPQILGTGAPEAQLGSSVAIRNGIAVAGAFREEEKGAAYRFAEPLPENLLLLSKDSLNTLEGGDAVPLQIRLAAPPQGQVDLTLSPAADVIVSSSSLKLTSENWKDGETVEVTGRDDALCDGSKLSWITVTATATGADCRYNGLFRKFSVTNDDDELACLADPERTVCTDGGGTVIYTIALTNEARDVEDAPAELRDILPDGVTVVTASADRGTAIADPVANAVRWTGTVPPKGGGAATITIVAALDGPPDPGPPDPILENRATLTYVRDRQGNTKTLTVGFSAEDFVPCSP